ncbi:hypothetical protein [Frankia sp. R82]|uniref:hypothetical protein n=1 Tax=Frankia sp. R82 TaxID=2950553 RepID=UPI002043922A|nr:hypothetical protein [Frankia sp. R82]MCM3884664.1 hypothetical protein [Frankia sp. R82]
MSTSPDFALAPLLEAFIPVDRDLTTAGVVVALEHAPTPPVSPTVYGGMLYARIRLIGQAVGNLGIDIAHSPSQQTLNLADQTQDYVLETPWREGRAAVWPVCVEGHGHPMKALLESDWRAPFWCCPRDASIRLLIGTHPGRPPRGTDLAP